MAKLISDNSSSEPKKSLARKFIDDIVHHRFLIVALTIYFGIAYAFIPPLVNQMKALKSISKNLSGVNYHADIHKSISFGTHEYAERIPSDSIPDLIKLFEKGDELADYCDTNNSPDIEKPIGNMCQYQIIFKRASNTNFILIAHGNINVSFIPSVKSGYFTEILTKDRDNYYNTLKTSTNKIDVTNIGMDKIINNDDIVSTIK
jgi:hypothetical protein